VYRSISSSAVDEYLSKYGLTVKGAGLVGVGILILGIGSLAIVKVMKRNG